MLNQPFTGRELYILYEKSMERMYHETTPEEEQEEWDKIGKTKKTAWNQIAKVVNQRMKGESS